MADAREQQREARRQKVLARSQAGHRAQVIDLATGQKEIAPKGATAVLDNDADGCSDQASVDTLPEPAQAEEDSGKSASRLAAERRRQRILAKTTERMAKVQGDRVIRGAAEAEGDGGGGGGNGADSLDDMLREAEAEFFGEARGTAGVADAKPAARQQAYFKSANCGGSGGGATLSRDGGAAVSSAAQSKPDRRRQGAAGSGFKPARPEGGAPRTSPTSGSSSGGAGSSSRRRPTGNKALEDKPFDLAAIQSLSRAAGANKTSWTAGAAGAAGAGTAGAGRKRLLGGLRFWTGLEGVTKTALLLLVGAGVGGLLLPDARAAVAQAKFEAAHMHVYADSRSGLEIFLAGAGGGGPGRGDGGSAAFDVGFDTEAGGSSIEFEDIRQISPSDPSSDEAAGVLEAKEAEKATEEGDANGSEGKGEEAGLRRALGRYVSDGEDGGDGVVSGVIDCFLSYTDLVLGWAHHLSAVSLPWGGSAGDISCVSAIYLALLVRFVVAAVFSAVRVVLGLPAFPRTASPGKPGMVMSMILASVPTLGKVLAWGNILKSVFADTNLVVAGTVLTLAFSLAADEGTGPYRLAGSISRVLGLAYTGPPGDGRLKEL